MSRKELLDSSICGGGEVSSRTMRLHKTSAEIMEMRRSFSQYTLYFSLIVLSTFVGREVFKPNDYVFWHRFFRMFLVVAPFSIGLVGLTVGFRLRKITFNKGMMAIEIVPGLTGKREIISFDEIQSLQLLHHRCGEDDFNHCYEVNLVFNDSERERYNLACYDNPKTAKNVIKELSIFMDKSYSLAGLYDYRLRD